MDVDADDFFDELDYALHLVRARRGLSQRGLAELVGLNPSRIARLEQGQGMAALEDVQRVLAAAGMRLQVVDDDPESWERATDSWEFRDRGERRFPAHRHAVLRRGLETWEWTRYQGDAPPFAWHKDTPREWQWRLSRRSSPRSGDGSS